MGTKQVRLDEDVYAKIADRKRDDETFSEAIDRLTDDWSLADFDTGMTDEERAEHADAIEEIETKTGENLGQLLDEMRVDE